jgi:hypothetical protein
MQKATFCLSMEDGGAARSPFITGLPALSIDVHQVIFFIFQLIL